MNSRNKRSFFERLTGTINMDNAEEEAVEEKVPTKNSKAKENWIEEDTSVGQLGVDVYQTPDNIFIKAMVAGVKPEDLDISIQRDMVVIRGKREEARTVSEDEYFVKELYWGEFSRTILLPAEVETENAEAFEKHGLLIVRLPKIDKDRQMKVRVKSNI